MARHFLLVLLAVIGALSSRADAEAHSNYTLLVQLSPLDAIPCDQWVSTQWQWPDFAASHNNTLFAVCIPSAKHVHARTLLAFSMDGKNSTLLSLAKHNCDVPMQLQWDEASGVLHIDCTHLVLSWSPRAPLATRLLPSDCQKLLSPDWNRRCFATDPVSGVTYVGCPGLRHLYAYAPGSASNSSSIVIPGDTGYAVAWPVVRPAQRQLYIVGFGAWIEDMRFSVAQYVLQLDEAGLAPVQGGLLANVSLSSAGWLLLYQVMVLVQADGSWIISLLLSDLPRRLLARASGRRYLHG